MLEIKDLHAGIEGKEILKGINLNINAGEVHSIMGPNGSGKSTLSVRMARTFLDSVNPPPGKLLPLSRFSAWRVLGRFSGFVGDC